MISDLSKMTEVREVPLRSTFMSDSERCPRYALLRHRAGLVLRGHTFDARFRGDIMHRIVAEVLRGKTQEQAEDAAHTRLTETSRAIVDSLTDSGYTPAGKTPEEAIKSLETETKVAIAMSRAYCKFFGIRVGSANILVEQAGIIIHRSLPVFIGAIERHINVQGAKEAGALDGVLIDEPKRELYVLDHKTSGRDVVQYIRTLPLAAQTLLYLRLAQALRYQPKPSPLAPELKVAGIIYNVIRTPTIRCCKTDDNDLDKYAARVEQWYEDNFDTVMAQTIICPSPELKVLSTQRLDNAHRYCSAPPMLENFPACGGTACNAYNSLCQFIGLCTTDTSLWPEQLERYDRDWRDDESKTGETP
jgi:hypothetical protein